MSTDITDHLQSITDLISSGSESDTKNYLQQLHPAEIALLIESLDGKKRETIWQLLDIKDEGDILLHLNEEIRTSLIGEMDNSELFAATKELETDDLADILHELPVDVSEQVLQSMDADRRQRLEAILSYPEDTAGGLMNTDAITIRADINLEVVLRYLRLLGELPQMTDNLVVINREGKFQGILSIADLLTRNPSLTVAEVILRDTTVISADMPAHAVARLFEKRDLISAPVIDQSGKFIGRITIDDVVDVIRDEADHSLMSMAGLNEEQDIFAPVVTSSRRRTVWLGVNLITALLASWVIAHFDDTIERLVALAILMPVVASMGGIAGSQTLTLVLRGIALGQVTNSNAKRLINKEMLVGSLNGIVWATIVGTVAFLWFHDYQLGIIIAIAMLINLVVAALAGACIPILLHRLGIDPALAGNVLLTTVTDVIGFLAFLGLAALYLV
jgi:magnesium transporter